MSTSPAFKQHPEPYRPPHIVKLQQMANENCPWFTPWYVRENPQFPNFAQVVSVGPYGESHVLNSLWELAMFYHWCRIKDATTEYEPPPEPYAPLGRALLKRAGPG